MDNNLQRIETLVNEAITAFEGVFVVSLKIKAPQNVKVYLDADQGLTIETCTKINRILRKQIEEQGIYPEGEYSLEVSSAGVGEPLVLPRQYIKNIGRKLQVIINEEEKYIGKLISVEEGIGTLEWIEGKGKKATTLTKQFDINNIQKSFVEIVF
jgi:ribosome maturation factor RimP